MEHSFDISAERNGLLPEFQQHPEEPVGEVGALMNTIIQ